MKELTYKKVVERLEGYTEKKDYIEIQLGKKLVVELYKDGQGPIEIPLADILELGLRAYEAQNKLNLGATANYVGGVRQ